MRLRVSIGSCKDDLQTAWVNVDDKPTEIDSKYWVGRVLVRVRDFDGYTPDGSPPATHSDYFDGRNRRFHIQAEGRFKQQYNGDQIWFGTQFDHMIGNFPETLFNAGMRIAKYIDPAVFYDKNSATPYIMSPYLACVNTLSAWPAPHRSHDAVLALENGNALTESDDEHPEDEVPREEARHDKKSVPAKPIRYWSFQGFREDETSNTLQRKPTRDSLLQEQMDSIHEHDREGSIKTQSTKFDGERMLTAENPDHRMALRRLGSYGRDIGYSRSSLPGGQALSAFPETVSEDEYSSDNDDQSFYTAAEYIIEDQVQPDGTIVPVKKKKKGLSVKKVRKSLHIPSAKTVQKNMRGLSIKRKDKSERKDTMSAENDGHEHSRGSMEAPATRKSIDLMRPFRFGNHDKEQSSQGRKSSHLERESVERHSGSPAVMPRTSTSNDSDFSTSRPPRGTSIAAVDRSSQSVTGSTGSRGTAFSASVDESKERTSSSRTAYIPSPALSSMTHSSRVDSASTLISTPRDLQSVVSPSDSSSAAVHYKQSAESTAGGAVPEHAVRDNTSVSSSSIEDTTKARNPSSTGQTEIRGDDLSNIVNEDDGLSHKLDAQLGPWRFSNPKIEPIEDTAFIFGDTSHSVKDRRKHFAKSPSTREEFEFDPDIVYCMSFFLPYMNFNTFDLKLGPLGANLHKYVDDQPVRYMARSAERPDEVFFMVEFSLE